tara:strand:- start:44 stop:433 length:390 start_codon:yes stop_codon:yes gene_type:complete
MIKNQLFKMQPNELIIFELLNIFGIKNLLDDHYFTKDDLIEINTIEKLNNIKNKLELYYIPCKAKIYLSNINEKRAITILRQFLKTHNYTLQSKEKYIKNIKYNIYKLTSIDDINIPKIKDRKIIIDFT